MEQLIIEILDSNIIESEYESDYLIKLKNNNYIRYLNIEDQISLNDFGAYLKQYKEFILSEIRKIKTRYIFKSYVHGLNHNIKVLLFALYIAYKNNLDDIDLKILIDACIYHDIGRINDIYDEKHGLRSAEVISKIVDSKIYKDKESLNMLKAIVEYHSIPDKFNKRIFNKYKLQNYERFILLANILKDADGLDRVRTSINNKTFSDLNPKYLRLDESKKLVKVSHIVNMIFYKKL